MNMKKWIKIGLIILSIISTVWIAYIIIRGTSKKGPTVLPAEPKISQTYKGSLSISLKLKESDFKYPGSLPFLEITRQVLTEDYFNKIASFLGFTESSTQINDAQDGLTYFWRTGNKTLFAYANTSKIRFTSGGSLIVPNKQLSDVAVTAIVNKFLTDSGILTTGSFSLDNVQYLKDDLQKESFRKSTKDDFTLFQVNILPGSAGYEIISPTSTESTNYVQLTQDGNIYAFQIIVFGAAQKGPVNYSIKTYNEVADSIDKSILISLDGEETPMQDLPPDFVREISVSKIDVAYLLDTPSSTSLQPVYKLTGVATLSNSTQVEAILYLTALTGL